MTDQHSTRPGLGSNGGWVLPAGAGRLRNLFKTHRDRPILDLLLHLQQPIFPEVIWDLGCGEGETTVLLQHRHPFARVGGLDLNPTYIDVARQHPEDIDWVVGDIADFAPKEPVDLLVSSGVMQWLPNHEALFVRLASFLNQHGVMAIQMPSTYEASWHRAIRHVARLDAFAPYLTSVQGIYPVQKPEDYFRILYPMCENIQVWTTDYVIEVEGKETVLGWMENSGMRPYLSALAPYPEKADAFKAEFLNALTHYLAPAPAGVTLISVPRLFVTAQRRG